MADTGTTTSQAKPKQEAIDAAPLATQKAEFKKLTEHTCSLWAIQQLAEMLEGSNSNAAYDNLSDNEWSAIGIAIRQMAAMVHNDIAEQWELAGEQIDAFSPPPAAH